MRKKINGRFIMIALYSIVMTTLVMTAVFYTHLQKQVFSDLQVVAQLLSNGGNLEKSGGSLRVTLIDKDGTVLFDSALDEQSLDNHKSRPEIEEAFATGTGEGIRRSDTLSKSVYYYAIRQNNGQVLRVGKESKSVLAVLLSALPVVMGTAALLSVVCLVFSHYLTAAIVKPIEDMAGDMEHMREEDSYPELVPFARKIRQQHEEILSAANVRQEFTTNVTHELKTPLAAISGYAELMEAGMVNQEDTKHFAGEIRKSAGRLLNLINDIIKLSQLDDGSEKEHLEVVNLAEIAAESVEMLSVNAKKNNVRLSYSGVPSARIRIGKELAQELLYNLIENAVRYNKPEGLVSVRVKLDGSEVVLSVEDTGIGIPAECQERIFERFYRVDKSRSKALGGTGLGLAIVKHICTLTDGSIELTSQVDVGTCITIRWRTEH